MGDEEGVSLDHVISPHQSCDLTPLRPDEGGSESIINEYLTRGNPDSRQHVVNTGQHGVNTGQHGVDTGQHGVNMGQHGVNRGPPASAPSVDTVSYYSTDLLKTTPSIVGGVWWVWPDWGGIRRVQWYCPSLLHCAASECDL